MADKKFSDLGVATSVGGSDLICISQGGVSKQAPVSLIKPALAIYQASSSQSPTAITGNSLKMFGMGNNFQITPTSSSGRVLVIMAASYYYTSGGAYTSSSIIRYGLVSGGVPANGAAGASYATAGVLMVSAVGPNVVTSPTFTGVITGLSPNNAYWFDISTFSSNIAGVSNLAGVSATIVELP